MPDTNRRLILGNGEQYIQDVKKPVSGRSPDPPRTYDEARELVKAGVTAALADFAALPETKKFSDEAVFCLRLHPDAMAKSYDPAAIFSEVPELRNVGSRHYQAPAETVAQTKRIEKLRDEDKTEVKGRLVFVQGPPEGFERLLRHLDRPTSRLKQQFRDEIQRVERFDTLSANEQVLGFAADWKEGRAELVLHPTSYPADELEEFLQGLFEAAHVDVEKSRVRQYPGGPTFVSCRMTRKSLAAITGTNPLRAAHPLSFRDLTDLRSAPTAAAPRPSTSSTRSTIKIGMFDGGVDPTVPLLKGHVEEDLALAIPTLPLARGVAHGTAVAGTLLYGPLNGFKATDRVSAPPVFVVSIRVLPTSDPKDVDLYEAIDVVERAVPARKDIKVFNLSFGPRGPIDDDPVSRFTYVLDDLAFRHKVTFYVAVGNDGEAVGLDRIQAPSDLVHGVGVGAFTMDGDKRTHAPYSCKGPGRECGKIKPDLTAFGGCENTPIHLTSTTGAQKWLAWGTSFATPVAARLGGQACEVFERSSALLGRALLIHTAEHPVGPPDSLFGHGCVRTSIDDVLFCDEKTVTVVFQGDILPTKIVKLPIPWPAKDEVAGKVQVTWTVAALPPINPNHPGDYTSCCLEDTFYPHSRKFQFTPPKGSTEKPKGFHLDEDATEIHRLLKAGWKCASFPESESGNQYKTENDKRAIDCKWEPVVLRTKSKLAKNIHDPFMTIHAIGRNGAKDRFDYVVVVTLQASKYDGDLYHDIRTRFPALSPIRLRTEAELRVQIS
jgi:subtilisin family serine protease